MLQRRWPLFFLFFVFLIASLWAWQGNAVEVVITLGESQDRPIQVSPDTVELTVGQRLVWRAEGDLEGALMIDLERGEDGERGPFPPSRDPNNRSRGRYRENARTPIRTLPAALAGDWKYTVVWFDSAGNRNVLDPVVSVRK